MLEFGRGLPGRRLCLFLRRHPDLCQAPALSDPLPPGSRCLHLFVGILDGPVQLPDEGLRAAELRDSGIALSAAVHLLSDYRDRMCQVFTVDNLKYLCSTGRLSNAKAAIGNILNIKPLLKGDSEGKIVNFGKVRGRKNSLRAIAEQYREYVVDAANQTVGIAHADCIEDANTLAELISEIAPPKDILTVMYEPVTGSHVGPGTLALFFVGKKGFRQAKS